MVKFCENCNYRCATCGNWKKKEDSVLDKKTEHEILLRYEGKLFFLSITGGEPFLYERRLLEFINHAKNVNPKLKYVSVNTNCSKPQSVKETIEKILSSHPNLIISLGLQYIPNERWGVEKTGIKNAFLNYKETEKVANQLKLRFKGSFSFYKIITISRKKDAEEIKKEDALWLNFAAISSFYHNTDNNYIKELSKEEKLAIIDKFRKVNKKEMSFLNKRYLQELRKTIAREKRGFCYAGINRIYVNSSGAFFICSREVRSRKEMSPRLCNHCWTACEANFDLLANFFIPSPF